MKFRYFSCVEGSAVRRFGTDAHIGARVVPGRGYVFDPDAVVPVPEDECRRYVREYANALKRNGRTGRPCLVERTEDDYSRYLAGQQVEQTKAAKAAKRADAAGDAETIVPGAPDEPAEKAPKKRSTGRRRVASSGGED